jgi:hypothetical protein
MRIDVEIAEPTMRRLRLWLPLIYCLVALGAWIDFARLPPDGLASLGLWLVVFPVAALDLLFRSADRPGSSIFMPDGHGYYGDHAIFFSISVALIAAVLYAVGAVLDRRRRR